MTASKSLPARPSLESLRKQAKKLARDAARGDKDALARVQAHLPHVEMPLARRNAQLVVAREYGFAGWRELTAEVARRLGRALEWAAREAQRLIHVDDVAGLKALLAEYPALPAWRAAEEDGGLLGMAAAAYGDAGDAERERWYTRAACAELLLDAGAAVTPAVCRSILESRARGLLELLHRKRLQPATLEYFAALGDLDAVRAELDACEADLALVNDAFARACAFGHEPVALLLLARSAALDAELAARIGGIGSDAFVRRFVGRPPVDFARAGLWLAFVADEVARAAHDGDVAALVGGLESEPRLLGDDWLALQDALICAAVLNDHAAVIEALLGLDAAIARRRPPPPSQAIEFALTYAKTHLVPLLTRIWPLPDDLPHAAGMGDLERVKSWLDPELRDVGRHYPANDARARRHLHWEGTTAQQVLDVAFAFAVVNGRFDVADFLLESGADVDTSWNSHEPASILHHLVFLPDPYERMQYLIDRGIDLTIRDYRWNATAQGWAYHALKDDKMARWLGEAERRRARRG